MLPTYFALTLSYVHIDPDSLPSFADKCSFGNWSSDTYHQEDVAVSKEPPDITNTMKNCKDCNTAQGPEVIAGPWSKSASV